MKSESFHNLLIPNEIGELVDQFITEGRIVSIFDTVVNIQLGQGIIISLVKYSNQMTALSIKCPAFFKELQSKQLTLLVGEAV